nr:MAG TPA: tail tape measure [Bacteriophage sp.]
MSNVVDERILSMKFDNKQFESGVATSMSTLDKLKQKLNLKGAAEGLQNVSAAVKNINFSGVSSGIETVQAKFSAMEVVAMTAISRITNSVITLGKRLVSAVTIDPIKDGFREYETQMNAVQTILANTQKEGTNVKVVNAALDELNHYADKTIYNFTEMTRNIGTFTAAGVKLNASVSAIKGIANLAAVSGSNSQQASTAMYQLSQALAAGTIRLMDWNSVVNAGMGGQVFQDALTRTSEHLQTGAKAAIAAKGSFRESLQTGWLTAEVLTQTLDQFATAAETQEEYEAAVKKFVSQGYTQEEAKQMADMAKTANEAATKVKTFTQLIDTLKEALGSGWTETWRTIIGDFEEARTMWTSVSDVLNKMINDSSDARNKVVKEWANLGGRTDLIEGFSNIFKGLVSIVTPIKEAFRDIFPPTTAKQLLNLTEGFKSLTEKIKISDETADKLKRTFKGLFSVVDMVKKAFELVATTIGKVFSSGAFGSVVDIILSITAAIGDMFTSLNEGVNTSGIASSLGKMVSDIAGVLKGAASHISSFGDMLSQVGQGISKVLTGIWDSITKVFGWISDNVSMGDILAGIIGGGIIKSVSSFTDLFDTITDTINSLFGGDGKPSLAKKISAFFGEISTSLKAFTTGVKISSLVAIAGALGILAASLRSIASLDAADITKSVIAIGAMFLMLNRSFKFISDAIASFKGKGLIKMGVSVMALAKAIDILASAMQKLAKIDEYNLAKSLLALAVSMKILTKGFESISMAPIPISTSIALIALAESCKVLGDALQKFSGLSWDEIARGLTGMGGALAEFVIVLKALSKFGGGKSLAGSASLLIAVQSLSKMAEGLSSFAGMSWEEIKRGLAGMGGALTEVATVTGLLGKLTGLKGLLGAGSLVLAVQSLADLQASFANFSTMSWNEIKIGLAGMGGALTEVAVVTGLLGKLTGLSGLIGAGSLVLAVQSLDEIANALSSIGALSWDAIKKGLTGMGGALVEIGVVSGALGELAGLSGLVGAGTIVLAVQSLDEIAQALAGIGSMSWEEIGRGLTGMGGALAELGTASGLTGVLTGFAGLIGAGTITLASQGLGQIADALQQFGSMSWDEIKRGLSAMQDALGEVALGGLMNSLSGFGADAIVKVAKPLGDLAESVNKWSSVTVPDNLGNMLTSLADGVLEFTLGGLGAGALATVAKPLGDLAASVQAWSGVSVPENLGTQIGSLASGINKFWASGMGAGAIAEVAAPLGTLAESVKAWSGVTIPEGLATNLQGLANGVMAFSFAFMGGFSISTITGPLADLATSVQAWSGVTIPEGLATNLQGLANGVKAFSFAFMGGWSLSAVTGPLGDLAGAVGKWNGINIPENLEGKLTSLANGVKAFSFAFLGGWSLSTITGPLGDLGAAVGKWSGVSIPNDLQNKLTSLANGVKSFAGIGDISSGVDGAEKVASAVKKLSGVDFSSIASGLGNLGKSFSGFASAASSLSGAGEAIANNLVTPIKNAAKQLNSVGSDIVNSISQGISGASGNLKGAMDGVLSTLTSTAKSKNGEFKSAGAKMSSELASGIKSGKASVNSAVTSTVSGAASKLRSYYSSFNSAGSYLAQGFASGIRSGSFAASVAARAMANAAKNAAAKALDEHSPSKVGYKIGDFFGVGFTNGIANNFVDSSRAGTKMADNAKEALVNTLSKMSNILDSDVDVQPVITPVLDLSNVTSGAASITSLLGGTQSVGVRSNLNAINTAMKLNQNGQNDDVISAIDKLRKEIGNLNSGDTYSINGIYASDDDIVDAIKTIVRAVKVERRV